MFPSLGAMQQLTLRAMVAYAARAARRVQPFFTLPDDDPKGPAHVAAVERAIRAAEEFARGTTAAPTDLKEANALFGHARFAPLAFRGRDAIAADQGHRAGEAAAYALRTANHAAKATGSGPDQEVLDFDSPAHHDRPQDWSDLAWAAWHAWAVAAYWIIPANAEAAAVAAWSDFHRLQGLGLGRFPELGEPIDPSEDGPLGPLWPEER